MDGDCFHVIVDLKRGQDSIHWWPLFSDLSESVLRERFVDPLKDGKAIAWEGATPPRGGLWAAQPIQREEISAIRIVKTPVDYRPALNEYRRKQGEEEERFMRESGMALPGNSNPAADLLRVGKDVTTQYV